MILIKWMDSYCIIRMIISLDRSGKIIRSLYEVLYLWSLLKIKMRILKKRYLQNLHLKPKHFLKLKLLLHPVYQNTLKPFN